MVTTSAIELIKNTTRDHMNSLEGVANAPNESEFTFWAFSHLCNHVSMTEKDRRRPITLASISAHGPADDVCMTSFVSLQDYFENDESLPFISDNRAVIGHSESPSERLSEDGFFLKRIFANLHNYSKVGSSFPPTKDEVTETFWRGEYNTKRPGL